MHDFEIRRATVDDVAAVVDLCRRALGWSGGDADAALFAWKHFENAFGASPTWIAVGDDGLLGVRTFMRWRLIRDDGTTIEAARAVDTATAPEAQRRGVFTALTRTALDGLESDGIALIFNTPNERSLPGYLKLGWSNVGRLPVAVMPSTISGLAALATARQAAARTSLESTLGEDAPSVLADREGVARLLASVPRPRGVSTPRGPDFLAWRYGLPQLRYRALLFGEQVDDGVVIFRLRRRGAATEAVVCDLLVPGGDGRRARTLTRAIARRSDADYLLRVDRRIVTADPFARVPGVGPVLACRTLDASPVPALGEWALAMGDVELF